MQRFKITQILTINILFISIVFSAFKMNAQYSINPPPWIENLPQKDGYIYAVGSSKSDSLAIVEAKTNLCAYFQTNVSDVYKGNAGSIMKYDAVEGKIDKEYKYDLFETFIWSSNRLAGLRNAATWISPDKIHYILVELNLKEHYLAQRKDKVRIISFIDAAENNNDPGIKLRNYLTAIALTTTVIDTINYRNNGMALIYCINRVSGILNNIEVCGGYESQPNTGSYYSICLRYHDLAISNIPFYFDVFNKVGYSDNNGAFIFDAYGFNTKEKSTMNIVMATEELKLPLPHDISPEEKAVAMKLISTIVDVAIVHNIIGLRNSVAIVSNSYVDGESKSPHKINRKLETLFSKYNVQIVSQQNADIVISTIIDTDFSSKVKDLFCYKSEGVVVVMDNNGLKIETIDFSGESIREDTKRLSTVESKAVNFSIEDMIEIIADRLKESNYFENSVECCK